MTVFAPSLVLTIVIERAGDRDDLHLHAGGQGLWIARMAAALDARVTLCTALGGETGSVLRGLLADEDIAVEASMCSGANGSYVHDRRSGRRRVISAVPEACLSRHEADDLFELSVVSALRADAAVLTGGQDRTVLEPDAYARLATDAEGNGVPVIADLTGPPLTAVLSAGVTLVKLSDSEMIDEGLATGTSRKALGAGIDELRRRGARNVVISRGSRGSVAWLDGSRHEITGPRLTAADPRGAGDSMTAALAVALARRQSLIEATRLATAAGALNAARHGLGTGGGAEVDELAPLVQVDGREE